MATPLWFGTKQNFQFAPMPSSGIQRRNVFSSESGTLDRGGAYVSRSIGRHAEFDFSFGAREAAGTTGLNVYQEYATGIWNDYTTLTNGFNPNNLIYFSDPMAMRANVLSPHWAAPMVSLTGDYPSLGSVQSHAATAANIYRQPTRTVTFDITHTANTLPTDISRQFLIPIPPGYTLRFGWSGAVTGTAVIRAEARTAATGVIVASSISPQTTTGATRMASSWAGNTYDYVIIGLARTSAVASTAAIASMMAQIHPDALSPTLTGPHIAGVGQTGCMMDGDLIEEYIQADDFGNRRLKSLSFGLVEVGAWLP